MSRPPRPDEQIHVFTPKLISDLIFHLRKRAFVTFRGGETRTGAQVRYGDAPARHLGAWDVNVAARGLVLLYTCVCTYQDARHLTNTPKRPVSFPRRPPFFLFFFDRMNDTLSFEVELLSPFYSMPVRVR